MIEYCEHKDRKHRLVKRLGFNVGKQNCQRRKDRYNAKLSKYYITYEEGEEELSEDEERFAQQDQEAPRLQSRVGATILLPQVAEDNVRFRRNGVRSSRDGESDGGEDSSKEKEATVANSAQEAGVVCVSLHTSAMSCSIQFACYFLAGVCQVQQVHG